MADSLFYPVHEQKCNKQYGSKLSLTHFRLNRLLIPSLDMSGYLEKKMTKLFANGEDPD